MRGTRHSEWGCPFCKHRHNTHQSIHGVFNLDINVATLFLRSSNGVIDEMVITFLLSSSQNQGLGLKSTVISVVENKINTSTMTHRICRRVRLQCLHSLSVGINAALLITSRTGVEMTVHRSIAGDGRSHTPSGTLSGVTSLLELC